MMSASTGERGRTHDIYFGIGLAMVSARAIGDATAGAVGPFCLAGALTVTFLAWPAPAHADPSSTLLNDIGIGNNGPVSTAIAQVGTSLCPLLVKPGSTLASDALSSKGQLASQIAGGVATMAIQSQCPSFMTSLSNGDFSVLQNAASIFGMSNPSANPLSIPGVGTTNPFAIPGAAAANPLSLPGAATPNPLSLPTAAATSTPLSIPGATASTPLAPTLTTPGLLSN
ncbi:MAG TPA: hypothetical protein VFW21_05100 [Mycobacterium sp.]|nr:hypothetical protein [Mycobacterium sp.]